MPVDPARIVAEAAGVVAIAVNAYLTAAGLMIAHRRRRRGLTLAWLADLWGVLLVALLCDSLLPGPVSAAGPTCRSPEMRLL